MHICMHVCMYACMYAYVCMCTCSYIGMNVCINVFLHVTCMYVGREWDLQIAERKFKQNEMTSE